MVKKLIKWGMEVIKQKNVKPINASWYTPEPVMDHDQVFKIVKIIIYIKSQIYKRNFC